MILVSLLVACGPAELPDREEDAFAQTLSRRVACGDVSFGARDPDDTWALTFIRPETIAETGDRGVVTVELPDPGATVIVENGVNVGTMLCDDTMVEGLRVDASWEAIAGTATITIEPDGDVLKGTARLDDAIFERVEGEGDDEIALPYVEIGPYVVDWYPG